jgi:hypothetical protein
MRRMFGLLAREAVGSSWAVQLLATSQLPSSTNDARPRTPRDVVTGEDIASIIACG